MTRVSLLSRVAVAIGWTNDPNECITCHTPDAVATTVPTADNPAKEPYCQRCIDTWPAEAGPVEWKPIDRPTNTKTTTDTDDNTDGM